MKYRDIVGGSEPNIIITIYTAEHEITMSNIVQYPCGNAYSTIVSRSAMTTQPVKAI